MVQKNLVPEIYRHTFPPERKVNRPSVVVCRNSVDNTEIYWRGPFSGWTSQLKEAKVFANADRAWLVMQEFNLISQKFETFIYYVMGVPN